MKAEGGKIAELLERVEKATGPDKYLAVDIYEALGFTVVRHADGFRRRARRFSYLDAGKWHDATPILGSIDAALGLVERLKPDWFWRAGRVPVGHWVDGELRHCWCHLSRTDASNCLPGDEATGWANTICGAILAALLKALSPQP